MLQFLKGLFRISKKNAPACGADTRVNRLGRACASDVVDHEQNAPKIHWVPPPNESAPDRANDELSNETHPELATETTPGVAPKESYDPLSAPSWMGRIRDRLRDRIKATRPPQ